MDSLLVSTTLNYIGHRACVCRASAGARKERKYMEMADLDKQKDMTGGQYRKHLHMETNNGVCLSDIPHCLNITELSRG